jgi:hypothetical protein
MAQNDQNNGLQLQIASMEQFKDLTFLQSETNPTDLVVKSPDGFEIVFQNYIPLAQAGTPPAITLEDGTVIPGNEIVSLIDNLNYDLIAPAAGNEGAAPNGGGASFAADPSGLLGDDLDHGPYQGGIQLADAVGFGQFPGGRFIAAEPTTEPTTEPTPTPVEQIFEAIDDHVIHNNQSGIVDIPDIALRHNDIYPSGNWDLTSVYDPGPLPEADVSNSDPDGNDLGTTTFQGANSTARFDDRVESDGLPGNIGEAYNNNGDNILELSRYVLANADGHREDFIGGEMIETNEFASERVQRIDWDTGQTILRTDAPGPASTGINADWDGGSVYLYAGETITLSFHGSPNEHFAHQYVLAIDDPNVDSGGYDPLNTGQDLDWDVTNYIPPNGPGVLSTGESISYHVQTTGWHYVGTGFNDESGESGDAYFTQITIDGIPEGYFDYAATDETLSDDAHVTVDALEEIVSNTRNENGGVMYELNGDEGDDIIISGDTGDVLYGYEGMDVLIGRGGDDHLYGGTGRDLFLFEDVYNDGSDTIFDFSIAEGDIVNLDILFDALGTAPADREGEVLMNEVGGDTILTVQTVPGSGFSITFDNTVDLGTVESLINSGNLVVDES